MSRIDVSNGDMTPEDDRVSFFRGRIRFWNLRGATDFSSWPKSPVNSSAGAKFRFPNNIKAAHGFSMSSFAKWQHMFSVVFAVDVTVSSLLHVQYAGSLTFVLERWYRPQATTQILLYTVYRPTSSRWSAVVTASRRCHSRHIIIVEVRVFLKDNQFTIVRPCSVAYSFCLTANSVYGFFLCSDSYLGLRDIVSSTRRTKADYTSVSAVRCHHLEHQSGF